MFTFSVGGVKTSKCSKCLILSWWGGPTFKTKMFAQGVKNSKMFKMFDLIPGGNKIQNVELFASSG